MRRIRISGGWRRHSVDKPGALPRETISQRVGNAPNLPQIVQLRRQRVLTPKLDGGLPFCGRGPALFEFYGQKPSLIRILRTKGPKRSLNSNVTDKACCAPHAQAVALPMGASAAVAGGAYAGRKAVGACIRHPRSSAWKLLLSSAMSFFRPGSGRSSSCSGLKTPSGSWASTNSPKRCRPRRCRDLARVRSDLDHGRRFTTPVGPWCRLVGRDRRW